jgi:hypothetical protein
MSLPTVHVLYENPAWMPPLEAALEAEGFSYVLHHVNEGVIDPAGAPPEGIWINRMSPSSHTRGHETAVPMMREWLQWLEAWGRRVINGGRAFELEMSKLRQALSLGRHGILTPRTVMAVGREALLEQASTFEGPFITKHNRGGKGLGIQLFGSSDQLAEHLDSGKFDPGPGGMIVLQEYIAPAEPFITRVEIVSDRFLFAMRSSTADGFELCPSDACQAEAMPDVCPADGGASPHKFQPDPMTADDPLVAQYIALMKAEGIDLAGIEFVTDDEGTRWTYDINGTTNYNAVLGEEIGVDGMRELARFIRTSVVPAVTAA